MQVQCDCAVITESWLTKKQQDAILSMADYSLFRRDRKGGKGGGLCVYVRQNVACSVFETVNSVACPTDKIEIMWLECVFNKCRYFVACCYHPPNLGMIINFLLKFYPKILAT